ncbi:MAG: GntR family transcriptional regulator [Planctomycetota bacterium]|nr:GntR family transcriptional regulator [Planctomycetota bacterium]
MSNADTTPLLIDRADYMPVYRQVKQVIKRQVREKELRPGERIGSVAEMARLFQISTATVTKATSELIDEGVLYSKVGSGTYVADPAGKKTHTICFVVYSGNYITLPYFSKVVAGISDVAEAEHYKLQFVTSARVVQALDGRSPYPRVEKGKWTDGLIVMDHQLGDKQIIRLAEQLPVVLVERKIPGADIPCIRADDRGGAYQAISHLAKLGHKRIGIITPFEQWLTDREKVQGYRSAVSDLHLEADPDLIVNYGYKEDDLKDVLDALLNLASPPTAIFVNDDVPALDILQRLRERCIRVPQDVAVIGFGGGLSDVLRAQPLTTMQLMLTDMGRAAAEMLLKLINKKEEMANKEIVFMPTLVVKQSCGERRTLIEKGD